MSQNTSHAVMAQRAEPSEIISRQEAIAVGQRWYFTGCACPRGHIAKRSVSNYECRACVDFKKSVRRKERPDEIRKIDREKYHRKADKKREQMKRSREKHIERRSADDKERYGGESARRRAQAARWWRENRDRAYAYAHQRKLRIRRATPPWITKKQREEMTALYIEARNRAGEWHVDHIEPLCGKKSCGLHVPWNLQILTGNENRRKGRALIEA